MSLQLVANVIVLAAIYALVSTGYVLVYRVSRVLNLAHGELMMVGAYLLVATAGLFNGDPLLALVLAAICGLVMGIVVYAVLMRWMTGEAVLAAVLITIALGILLRGLSILIWTTQQFYPGATFGWRNPSVPSLPGVQISSASLAIVVSPSSSMSACSCSCSSPAGACACARPGRIRCSPSSAASACTASTRSPGAFRPSPRRSPACCCRSIPASSHTMATIGLKAFPAALVGGLDSLLGAVIGALIVAAAEIAAIQYVNPLLSDVVPFVVLLIVLAIRPWGLFGSREQLDRV